MTLSGTEHDVVAAIAQAQDDLVQLATDLIAFDTTTRDGQGPRQERALQSYLAERLAAAGATTDVWEPTLEQFTGSRQIPTELDFTGYPQLQAVVPGEHDGRCLLLNGHIDTVTAEDPTLWTSDPHQGNVRAGRLFGRGACDQKGGVAAMVFAAEILAHCGVRLAGDLVVNTVTDEESTSAGAIAALARGVRADAAIVTEPTGLDIAIACRGSLLPVITVPGVAGHAAAVQRHWHEGGAVSATEKAATVLSAVTRLREIWRDRPDQRHSYLPPGNVLATMVNGGQWPVSHAQTCEIACHISYLPGHADAEGYGTRVEHEFTEWLHLACAADPWLRAHPPHVRWTIDVPPAEISPTEPIVESLRAVTQAMGAPGRLFGADFWHDGASFIHAGIPSVVFGPGDVTIAHTVDEYVPISDLVAAAQIIAVTAMRFCGTSG